MVEAAWSAARAKETSLAARFRRIAGPRPDPKRKKKAAVTVARKILIAAWHVMDSGQPHHDLGSDWHARREDPDRRKDRLIRQLQQLGYQANLTPAA